MLVGGIFIAWFAVRLLLKRGSRISISSPVIIMFVQIATLIFIQVYHAVQGDEGQAHLVTAATLGGVVVAYLTLDRDKNALNDFVHYYVLIMVIMAALAAISVMLSFAGLLEARPVYDRGLISGEHGNIVYLVGPTLTNSIYSGYFIRPSGLFDEPGQFGIYIMLALLANAVVLKKKMYEAVLIISSFFVFSLGLYITIILYLFLWRRKVLFILLGAVLVVGSIGVFSAPEEVRFIYIYNSTIARFSLLGTEFGGNRTEEIKAGVDMFWNMGAWGLTNREWETYDLGNMAASFWGQLLSYGILGGIILYLHLLLLGVSGIIQERGRIDRLLGNNFFRAFIVVAVSLTHRPNSLNFIYYLVLLAIYSAGRHMSTAFNQSLKVRV